MLSGFLITVFFYFYLIVCSSVNILTLLVLVEFLILFCFLHLVLMGFSYLTCLFFILIGVCMGAYSICVFIFLYRCKVSSYLFSSTMMEFS
ncbi:NADH dehydrogenase subunit 4L (mitochondrion) [Dermatophagoides farinae]|uniref:NADH dehydrogenase subunit 4L n=1 Tax=Dermatophagoides farinae TaxID=6954 RepID=UPI0001B2DB85|nr:NADH dehydrogenase subunit 4L [Dermatophagoides farinae]ACV04221.1 NADH dehydrogenase subunit 4L [Dermatophagoides farinae]